MKNKNALVAAIKEQYVEKEETKLDQLLRLDRKVKLPAEVFTYSVGVVGALTLGAGMCLAMKVIGAGLSFAMPLGILIGCVGIAAMSVNYFAYKRILKNRKQKYAGEILALSDEIMRA